MVEVAKLYAPHCTIPGSGWSIRFQHHGALSHWMLVTLAAMLGRIGLSFVGMAVEGAAWMADGVHSRCRSAAWSRCSRTWAHARFQRHPEHVPGREDGLLGRRQPVCPPQHRNRRIKAWQTLETVVVHEFPWTATARFADLVLPPTTSCEREDIETVDDYAAKALLAMSEIVEPMSEARNNLDVFADVSDRLGAGDAFSDAKDEGSA